MSVARARSKLANDVKRAKREPTPALLDQVLESRRDLAPAKLEAYIASVVAEAPELSEAQKHALSLLLRGAA